MRAVRNGILLGLALALAGTAWAGGMVAAVSIEPQRYMVEKVGGHRVEALVLVPAGSDPHVYEPRPSQMRALAGAKVYFTVGLEMERAWLPRFRAVNPAMRVAATDAGLAKLAMAGHRHGDEAGHGQAEAGQGGRAVDAGAAAHKDEAHAPDTGDKPGHASDQGDKDGHAGEDHGRGLPDPHVWLSPARAKVLAAAVRDALTGLDPAGAAEYAANHAAFAAECDVLSAEIATLLGELPSRAFMVFHPSWGYFADEFGLTQLAIEAGGSEPGPRELARIVDAARENNIRAVFVAPQFSQRTAEAVAREIGAGLIIADPLARDWAENLRSVARALAAAATRN